MRRRLMMLKRSSSGLPEGYTAVDYLESDQTQWIEMGVAPNQNTKAVLKIKITKFPAAGHGTSLIGSRSGDNSNDQFFTYIDTSSGVSRFIFRVDGQTAPTVCEGLSTYSIYIVTLSGTEMKVELEDGTAVFSKTYSISDFESTVTMTLFKSKPFPRGFKGRIYSCKLYSGDELIQDFVPCLDTDGVPCMFDLVSRKSFYNVGTGSFTWG